MLIHTSMLARPGRVLAEGACPEGPKLMRADSGSSCSAKKGSSMSSKFPNLSTFFFKSMLQPHLH